MIVRPPAGATVVWIRQSSSPTESSTKLPSSSGPERPSVLNVASSSRDCSQRRDLVRRRRGTTERSARWPARPTPPRSRRRARVDREAGRKRVPDAAPVGVGLGHDGPRSTVDRLLGAGWHFVDAGPGAVRAGGGSLAVAPGVAARTRQVARRWRSVRHSREEAARVVGARVGGGSPAQDRAGPRRPQCDGVLGPDRTAHQSVQRVDASTIAVDRRHRPEPPGARRSVCRSLAACAASIAGSRTKTSSMAITTISMLRQPEPRSGEWS